MTTEPAGLLREALDEIARVSTDLNASNIARAALAAAPVYDQESLEALNNLPLRFGTPANPSGLREAAIHDALMMIYGECHHDRGEPDCKVLRLALAATEPGRQSPCDDEQLATAFAKGVVAAHESLAADEPGLDVERLIRDLAQKSGYGQKVADALIREYDHDR